MMGNALSRRAGRLAVMATALLAVGLAVLVFGQSRGTAADVPLTIAIQGNHFVNGAGQTVRLLGGNHPSLEYACEQGWGYDDGHMDANDAAALASWHATAMRVPLNEDCWLGINGQPSTSQGPLTVAGYREAVTSYVSALNAAGLYVILDLHWTAPGTLVADGQRPMPDDHSAAFWTSVASTFASNPAVVFDAFNEPYSPAAVNGSTHAVDWDCWRSGGCAVPPDNDSVGTPDDAHPYTAVGMQTIVNAIRGAGAHQPILLGGLDYANDLSGWLTHEPTDPDGQLAASFHNYQGKACEAQACWNSEVAPVAAQVPVVGGEFDQDVCAASTFDVDYMGWADAHGVSYLAWGWWVLSPREINDAGCSAYYLTSDANGTPASPNGVNLHDHLVALAAAGMTPAPTPTTPTTPTPTTATPSAPAPPVAKTPKAPQLSGYTAKPASGGRSVRFVVKANQASSGVISAKTAATFTVKQRTQHVTLGSVRFTLVAGRSRTVTLALTRTARRFLAKQRNVRARITITLTNAARRTSVSTRTLTLRAPPR